MLKVPDTASIPKVSQDEAGAPKPEPEPEPPSPDDVKEDGDEMRVPARRRQQIVDEQRPLVSGCYPHVVLSPDGRPFHTVRPSVELVNLLATPLVLSAMSSAEEPEEVEVATTMGRPRGNFRYVSCGYSSVMTNSDGLPCWGDLRPLRVPLVVQARTRRPGGGAFVRDVPQGSTNRTQRVEPRFIGSAGRWAMDDGK